jgi:hypothetical protein
LKNRTSGWFCFLIRALCSEDLRPANIRFVPEAEVNLGILNDR